MTAAEVFRELLQRLDFPGEAFKLLSGEEAELWPTPFLDALESCKFLQRTESKTATNCTECDESHIEPVQWDEAGAAFLRCPVYGRVPVKVEHLRLWRYAADSVATLISVALGIEASPVPLIADRCWSLGLRRQSGLSQPVFLLRGAQWPDARELFERRFALGETPLILSLSPAPQPRWNLQAQWTDVTRAFEYTQETVSIRSEDFPPIALPSGLPMLREPSVGQKPVGQFGIVRQGKMWELIFEGEPRLTTDLVGFGYLVALLQNPGRSFSALELLSLASGATHTEFAEDLTVSDGFSTEDVLDAEARRDYQQRITQLNALKSLNGLQADEERELGDLQAALRGATAIGGRPRKVAGPLEQARTSVSQALSRTFNAIEKVQPKMAQHLRNSIKRGVSLSYEPDRPILWDVIPN